MVSAKSASRMHLDFVVHSLCRTGDEIDLQHFTRSHNEIVCDSGYILIIGFLNAVECLVLTNFGHLFCVMTSHWSLCAEVEGVGDCMFVFSIVDCGLIQDGTHQVFLRLFCIVRGVSCASFCLCDCSLLASRCWTCLHGSVSSCSRSAFRGVVFFEQPLPVLVS